MALAASVAMTGAAMAGPFDDAMEAYSSGDFDTPQSWLATMPLRRKPRVHVRGWSRRAAGLSSCQALVSPRC